jgi:hypothetical protein
MLFELPPKVRLDGVEEKPQFEKRPIEIVDHASKTGHPGLDLRNRPS